MRNMEFTRGDVLPPSECGIVKAGIHSHTGKSKWGHRIEINGRDAAQAKEIRDFVLRTLNDHANIRNERKKQTAINVKYRSVCILAISINIVIYASFLWSMV